MGTNDAVPDAIRKLRPIHKICGGVKASLTIYTLVGHFGPHLLGSHHQFGLVHSAVPCQCQHRRLRTRDDAKVLKQHI